jgi:hypothetical protein
MLRRFPDWEVDEEGARMSGGEIELRGWERLPIVIR